MILYKFKSLENFEQVTEMLLSQRLYCPTPSELNDPLEGCIGVQFPQDLVSNKKSEFEQVAKYWFGHYELINQYRVCSFLKDPESILMWSYYTGGHAGICIETDMSEHLDLIEKVKYVKDFSKVDTSSIMSILTHKLDAWKHENEYRVIFKQENNIKFISAKFRVVLIGAGVNEKYFRPVFKLCAAAELPIEIASFSTTGEFMSVPFRNPYE